MPFLNKHDIYHCFRFFFFLDFKSPSTAKVIWQILAFIVEEESQMPIWALFQTQVGT